MPRWLLAVCAVFAAAPLFAQKKDPDGALAALQPGDGLKVELFAAEPMVINPTSMDVDHKGRVWVAEAVNYRRKPPYNRPILRKEGDRIQVLIDEKGEGKATKAVTFYQGEDLYGPLSVCVIPTDKGQRVLVAQSPNILEFTDADGDLKADGPPKKFLTGFGGLDHDHGVHGLHLGPDGKLYFTVGDSGVKDLQSNDGKGKKYTSNGTDCRAGTVWRCDLDGKNLELIAHNFRNNYEACVDSFGEIWLSDNDDDGNEQTRICFVMPGGNYGYHPRGKGESHWHEEQPGVVHKTLRTGFGSPTGIQFYEGSLLPKQYHNTLMHCDAGPREVRAFTRKAKGAGYELDKAMLLTSTDTWFRPSDVCTAPDGSVFVADWYDKRVGGHGMDDPQDGRIYRLTPKEHKGYKMPEVKLAIDAKLFDVMESPNLATRHLGSAFLIEKGDADSVEKVMSALRKEAPRKSIPPLLVRGLLTTQWEKAKLQYVKDPLLQSFAQDGAEPAVVAMGVRVERWFLNRNFLSMVKFAPAELEREKLLDTVSKVLGVVGVRELLCDARLNTAEELTAFFYVAAKQYDGKDIFYRAALNIACGTDAERRDKILADFEKHFPEWNDKVADLVWELRPKSMTAKLGTLLTDAKLTAAQKARIVDILAVYDDPSAGKTVLGLLKSDAPAEVKAKAVSNLTLFLPGKWKALAAGDDMKTAVADLLKDDKSAATGLQLVAAAAFTPALDDVIKLGWNESAPAATRREAIRTLGKLKDAKAVEALINLGSPETELSIPCIQALAEHLPKGDKGNDTETKALTALQRGVTAKRATVELRQAAVAALAGSKAGTVWMLGLKEKNEFPEELAADAGRLLRNTPFQDLKAKATLAFPSAGKLDPKKLPGLAELAKRKGNAENGKAVMTKSLTGEAQCLKCHMVKGTGGSIGPDLSMIGKKGGKDSLYESLLTPSKAIPDQYISWRIDSDDGQSVTGLLVEETAAKLTVRDANGKDYTFDTKSVTKKKDQKSIMPEDVIKAFTEDELADVVEYLSTLQTPSLTPDSWLIAGPFPSADDKALDRDFGPEKGAFDAAAKYESGDRDIGWRTIRTAGNGYFDLAAFHGTAAPDSLSYLYRSIESPADAEVTIRLGTDDGCRLWVNGEKVFGHEKHEAAKPDADAVKVKLKKGANAVLLKINNGSIPHGFYLTIEGGADLKVGK